MATQRIDWRDVLKRNWNLAPDRRGCRQSSSYVARALQHLRQFIRTAWIVHVVLDEGLATHELCV